jgi:hypothetical protein
VFDRLAAGSTPVKQFLVPAAAESRECIPKSAPDFVVSGGLNSTGRSLIRLGFPHHTSHRSWSTLSVDCSADIGVLQTNRS